MLYQQKPEKFNSKFEVVGCFIQCDDEIVLLHRQNHKPQGGTWGIPSGKIDEGEQPIETVCREIKEETGLKFSQEELKFFLTTYVKYAEYDFIYHIFYTEMANKAEIKVSEGEHKNAKWISYKDAANLPLIEDLDVCVKLFFDR